MKIKGMREWRDHLPGLTGKMILIIPLIGILSALSTWVFYLILDNISRWYPTLELVAIEPFLPIIGPAIALTIALLLVYSVWARREKLMKNDKATAYERGFKPGFAGVAIVGTTIFHIYEPLIWFPFNIIPWTPPVNPLTTTLASSIWDLAAQHTTLFTPTFQVIIGWVIFAIGMVLAIRTLSTLGFDYAAVVYLFYPEESHLVKHEIYGLVRNPLYAGILTMGFGGVLFRFSAYSLIILGLGFLVLLIHIHFIEDKELVQRFGKDFQEYQQNVPVLFVQPKNWGKVFKFLFGKIV